MIVIPYPCILILVISALTRLHREVAWHISQLDFHPPAASPGTHHQRCNKIAPQLLSCLLLGVPVREITAKHCWACQQACIIDLHWKLLTGKSVGLYCTASRSWHQNSQVQGLDSLRGHYGIWLIKASGFLLLFDW